jgi:hypothetical protein
MSAKAKLTIATALILSTSSAILAAPRHVTPRHTAICNHAPTSRLFLSQISRQAFPGVDAETAAALRNVGAWF